MSYFFVIPFYVGRGSTTVRGDYGLRRLCLLLLRLKDPQTPGRLLTLRRFQPGCRR